MFTFTTDPQTAETIENIVGLHVNPPPNAVVLCLDELPRRPRRPARLTHNDRRNG
jgi:hypothetical protein